MKKLIIVDFSGTLVLPFVAEKANLKRFDILGLAHPSDDDHKKQHASKSHYVILKNAIAKRFPLDKDIKYTQNKGKQISLSADAVRTMMMTDLFRDAMYFVATEFKEGIFTPGIVDALVRAKEKGYALAIVSGIRTDIITGMLAISNCPLEFDYILGQDPILSIDSNDVSVASLSKEGSINYVLGDKYSDLEPAKKLGAQAIWVQGPHSTGDEESIADTIISEEQDFKNLF